MMGRSLRLIHCDYTQEWGKRKESAGKRLITVIFQGVMDK
jgi:hypothetical protein